MTKKQKKILIRILITVVLLIAANLIQKDNKLIEFIVYLVPYIVIGYDIIKKAFKGILNKEVFDENFLMVVATLGAMLTGEYEESVMVMLLYQIGELFQSLAIAKSRKNIAELMDIRPEYANIERNGEIIQIDPSELNIGDIFIVKVGEKVPVDGIVVKGKTSLNTSALTGESKPKDVKENEEIISGCINMTSPISVKVSKVYNDSTVNKVLELVENASSNKSESEEFISKFAHYYTPIVCYLAIALVFIPPLFIRFILNGQLDFMPWINRALTFLVISCPCALVISIPLSFFGGIGGASNVGILIKGSNYIEQLAKTKIVAFDKTGTMTKGIFEVTTIHNSNFTKEELLDYAAHAEIYSNHPIGKSIIKEYGQKLDKSRVNSIIELPGKGIKAIIDNHEILLGNDSLLADNKIDAAPCNDEGTIIHLAYDDVYKGHIHIGDVIKPTSYKAIEELRKIKVKVIAILTGDDKKVGDSVGKQLKADKVYSNLLPQDKVNIIKEMLENKSKDETLSFVGDGINDAPVLALADVGIAMGALGSDAAIEAADVVLMDDDPVKVSKAIKIAKKCMRIVYENIYFAIGVKVICLILGAFGIASMWLAIFADVGVMVIAVLNAIRTLNVKYL